MRSTLLLFAVLVIAGNAEAGTICTNGICFTCDGSSVCVNGNCSCNGVPAGRGPALVPKGPCSDQSIVVHRNGGGTIATSATVAASVYVSAEFGSVREGRSVWLDATHQRIGGEWPRDRLWSIVSRSQHRERQFNGFGVRA